MKRGLEKLGLLGSMLGYVGDDNFHETILFDGAKERDKVVKCVQNMVRRAIEMEGICTVNISHILSAMMVTDTEYLGRAWHWPGKEEVYGAGSKEGEFIWHEGHQVITGSPLVDEHWESVRFLIVRTLYLHQMESLRVTIRELHQYARAMRETLTKIHYNIEINGNGIEFILVPLSEKWFQNGIYCFWRTLDVGAGF